MRSARDACAIVAGSSADELAGDMIRSRALVNCFTEIGEAAARVTSAGRVAVPMLPWRQIVGLRNIVVHVYWGIDLATLVKTTQDDLPPFIAALVGVLDCPSGEPKPPA